MHPRTLMRAAAAMRKNRGRARAVRSARDALSPWQFPAHAWKAILARTAKEIAEDNLLMYASSCAFYSFLAIFPALAVVVSLSGLIFSPQDVARAFQAVAGLLPGRALTLLRQELEVLFNYSKSGLGATLLVSFTLMLWSASQAMRALMAGLNAAYEEPETRGVVRYNATAWGLALGSIVFAFLSLALIVVLPAVLSVLEVEAPATWVRALRWPILAATGVVALAALYRHAPCRRRAKWRWVMWGALFATLLWLGLATLFSLYVAHFTSYDKIYGTLGAIVVLLLGFHLTALVVLIGGEFSAEIERQTARDTSAGAGERPPGRRGASMADSVAGED